MWVTHCFRSSHIWCPKRYPVSNNFYFKYSGRNCKLYLTVHRPLFRTPLFCEIHPFDPYFARFWKCKIRVDSHYNFYSDDGLNRGFPIHFLRFFRVVGLIEGRWHTKTRELLYLDMLIMILHKLVICFPVIFAGSQCSWNRGLIRVANHRIRSQIGPLS